MTLSIYGGGKGGMMIMIEGCIMSCPPHDCILPTHPLSIVINIIIILLPWGMYVCMYV